MRRHPTADPRFRLLLSCYSFPQYRLVVNPWRSGSVRCRGGFMPPGGEVNSPLREAFEAYGLGFTATTPAIRQSNIVELDPDLSAKAEAGRPTWIGLDSQFCT